MDLIAAQQRWTTLHQKSLAGQELTVEELNEAIELTRVLRETNTGPARKKKTANKTPLTKDQLSSILKG